MNDLEIKIYVDTCILSSLQKLDWKEDDRDSLEQISDMDNVRLMTSRKTLEEFLNYGGKNVRTAFKIIYKIIQKTPSRPAIISRSWGAGTWGAIPFGGGSTQDVKRTKLRNIFELTDSDHIYEASESKCSYFLTTDRKTILNRYKRNKLDIDRLIDPMKIVDPVDLLAILS